jgi:hypothetical protein
MNEPKVVTVVDDNADSAEKKKGKEATTTATHVKSASAASATPTALTAAQSATAADSATAAAAAQTAPAQASNSNASLPPPQQQQKDQLLVLPLRMVSTDVDSKDVRCGIISCYFKNVAGKWIGFTNAHLFAKSWNPKTGDYDHLEEKSIIGKIAYEGKWVNPQKRADITTTDANIITIGRPLGMVIQLVGNGEIVFVQMNDGVIDASQGQWCAVAPPASVKQGDPVILVRPD